MSARRLALVLVSAAMVVGCGGGASGPAGTIDPGGSSDVEAAFEASVSNPPENTVSMSDAGGSGDLITIAVNVTDVEGLYGAAFEVVFDTIAAEYMGFGAGSVFEQGSTPIYTVNEVGHRIVIGASRTGEGDINVSGTRPLITLTFRVKEVGRFPLSIENAALLDGSAEPQALLEIDWTAGSLVGS